eukprot:763901-Hanusia_phi.AAC.1
MFEDKSEYKNDYEYLYGLEPAPSYWQPEAGTKYTLFHKVLICQGDDEDFEKIRGMMRILRKSGDKEEPGAGARKILDQLEQEGSNQEEETEKVEEGGGGGGGFYRREVKGQDTERIEFMTQKV